MSGAIAQSGHDAAGHAAAAASHAAPAAGSLGAVTGTLPQWTLLIPFLPLLGCVLCGVCAVLKIRNKLPALITVACLAGAFAATVGAYMQTVGGSGGGGGGGHHAQAAVVKAWDWISFHWRDNPSPSAAPDFVANFSFYVDSLTCLWMLFVTGLATLIGLYASEYMAGDLKTAGYARFYAAFCLFVFSMACLVMGDNLLLLYLGWEGVGLCSYLLIGYFYKKPSAVAAAKKAFIMNRIGDFGLSMGLMLTYVQFGTVEYAKLFPMVQGYLDLAQHGKMSEIPWMVQVIPVLFTLGAFGKSAQLPLYVWLPDAMEGPTPVSALIHAATMVTAGVYLVARFFPLYLCSEWALPIVAWGGALTALLAATIGMAQFDIKRIMAYSTVSQLGFMFAGLGVLGAVGGASHVFTHAFFKAMLFLSCGAVMHGFAGQLDLRKLSGVAWMPGWKIVTLAMFVGCLNLAGFPFITAGFWSKDMIIGDAMGNHGLQAIGWILLFTAGLTAYYTFRVFFRVFAGPVEYHPGDEVHAHADDHGHDHGHGEHAKGDETHDGSESRHASEHFHPHAPGWAINIVLLTLAIASFLIIPLVHPFGKAENTGDGHGHAAAFWSATMVGSSTAGVEPPHAEHAKFLGMTAHEGAMYASIAVGLLGIAVAFVLHYVGRRTAAVSKADAIRLGGVQTAAQHKWYVDELYHFLIVMPLRVLSHIFHAFDKLIVDGLVNLLGWMPRGAGHTVRRTQSGVMHDYALRMAGGVALIVLAIWFLNTPAGDGDDGDAQPPPAAHASVERAEGVEGVRP
ncbi:MAG: NADH-quinone oxidoreductase subunit L [Phycisphaerales bacterium]|nr:NADH-quinone oxidoreductase subunit L [Phycisphaerales bacterium]